MTTAIRIENLVKSFGGTPAVRGVSLEVTAGRVLGLLGPNGAGKTTTVRMLATLVRPDGGRAEIHGYDVVRHAPQVRSLIGLTGQYAAVDQDISGWENLYLVGRLLDLPARAARARADEMLERFSLTEAGRRPAGGYSGGMRRRLDIAVSLVGNPKVLFLDEPTTGLDPRSRNELWDEVRALAGSGTTVLLTTQYMEEAEALADSLVVIDRGQVIASGSTEELRRRVGGQVLRVVPEDAARLAEVRGALRAGGIGEAEIDPDAGLVQLPLTDRSAGLTAAVRVLAEAGIPLAGINTHVPTLDEVFLTLTGAPGADASDAGTTGADGADTADTGAPDTDADAAGARTAHEATRSAA
ncbi:ATP-binding cassette domain-containing protein [Streptomyces sp. URMC 123]|uniref:ATP-binding cassette domain-containing protein n=1 Tax=Streptomyces sp. URMC 123 TaxID=3423403 RepID=UPI003F1BDBE0